MAGSMPPVHGDFLGVVTQNAEGNKIDWYLRRSINYRAVLNRATRPDHGGSDTEAAQLEPYARPSADHHRPRAGGRATIPGESELYVSVYSPWEEDGSSLNGVPLVMTDQQELGRFVYSAFVTVPAGATATIVLHLVGSWNPRERYDLGMYHQPLLFPDQVSTSVKVTG